MIGNNFVKRQSVKKKKKKDEQKIDWSSPEKEKEDNLAPKKEEIEKGEQDFILAKDKLRMARKDVLEEIKTEKEKKEKKHEQEKKSWFFGFFGKKVSSKDAKEKKGATSVKTESKPIEKREVKQKEIFKQIKSEMRADTERKSSKKAPLFGFLGGKKKELPKKSEKKDGGVSKLVKQEVEIKKDTPIISPPKESNKKLEKKGDDKKVKEEKSGFSFFHIFGRKKEGVDKAADNFASKMKDDKKEAKEEKKKAKEKEEVKVELGPPLTKAEDKKKVAEKPKKKKIFSGNKWRAPEVLKTNLIEDGDSMIFDVSSKLRLLFSTSVLAVIVVAWLYVGLIYWGGGNRENISNLNRELEELVELKESEEEKVGRVNEFSARLKIAKKLLDGHVYWTNLFSFFEENLLTDITLPGDFSGDLSGEFSFSLVADDYKTVVDQVMILDQSPLAEARTSSVVKGEESRGGESEEEEEEEISGDGVSFDMELKIDPKIFYK